MLLAVGTFVMFMVPVAVRTTARRTSSGESRPESWMRCGRKSMSCAALVPRMAELEERLDFAERC